MDQRTRRLSEKPAYKNHKGKEQPDLRILRLVSSLHMMRAPDISLKFLRKADMRRVLPVRTVMVKVRVTR